MARQTEALEVEGRRIQVSSPGKVLYPAAGFTKAQVIEYYVRAADYLLPHLADRPVTLKRYPDGVRGEHFYEKDAPGFTPGWVRTFPVPRRAGGPDIRYIVIGDLATLVWCANLANLEIHPFLHRVPAINTPTSVVFDLDPGEGAGVLECAAVAFVVRDALERLELRSFAKVSGSKGVQVYVPLNTQVGYDAAQGFAHIMAERLARDDPGRVVSEMPKHLRKGKVFIDWSQNADFKTTVGVYSLRAKRSRPYVSLPVAWKELEAALRGRDEAALYFEPEAALARLGETGDLFAPVLRLKQKLPRRFSAGAKAGSRKPGPAPRAPETEGIQAPPAAAAEPIPEIRGLPPTRARFLEPMRAKPVAVLPEGGWIYEVKLDGYRTLAVRDGGEVTLYSRNGNSLNSRFPEIAEALRAVEDGTVLDGEVVAFDKQGRPSFRALQNVRTGAPPLYYYVFDLPVYRGRDLTSLPLARRRELLERHALAGVGDPVRLSAALGAPAADLVAAAREQNLEGIVAKRAESRYQPGERTGAWVKHKTNRGQELVVGGYKPGRNGFEYLLVGYFSEGGLRFVGKIRNGFTPALKQEVAVRFQGLETEVCPFSNLPEPAGARRGEAITAEVMRKIRWLKPELVAQVEFTEWTAANHLRHSRFAGLRDDKDAREVVREAA